MRALLLSVLVAIGCSKSEPAAPPSTSAPDMIQAAVPSITVAELASKLGEYQAVDANGPGTRKKLGVIPGAVLLSDYEGYQPSELPADKTRPLVFYCANKQCSASDEAAQKAIAAGYQNVKVLPEGIAGWRNAGQQTASAGS